MGGGSETSWCGLKLSGWAAGSCCQLLILLLLLLLLLLHAVVSTTDEVYVTLLQHMYTVDLQYNDSLTVTCSYSCQAGASGIHPLMTIQFPGSFDGEYHTEFIFPDPDRFMEGHENLADKVTITASTSDCQNNKSNFTLHLRDIRSAHFNNSVIHCGVRANGSYFYSRGASYIRIINSTVTPTLAPSPTNPPLSTSVQETGGASSQATTLPLLITEISTSSSLVPNMVTSRPASSALTPKQTPAVVYTSTVRSTTTEDVIIDNQPSGELELERNSSFKKNNCSVEKKIVKPLIRNIHRPYHIEKCTAHTQTPSGNAGHAPTQL